ncbi:hypothetical protein N0V90_002716 [Kalmusia sp. IMI 367209]|nr:hypothetical protein N0V90_002716 [Kalmusia sp. IMI 367209]
MATPTRVDGPLTPIIKIDTKVAAPNRSFKSVNSDPGLLFGDGNKTITLNVCSEFVNESTILKQLDGNHKLRIVEDASSQPAIFTRGSNNVGWQPVDITPLPESRGGVTTFDVMKTIDKRIVICTAFADLSGEIAVYHCTITNFSVKWNVQTQSLDGLDPKNKRAASHFVLDPTFNAKLAWRSVRVGASVSAVRESYAANLYTGRGLFTLFDYPDGSSGCVFDSWDGTFHYKMRLDDFGNLRSIFPNQNPWNMTDLLVATERGIAFVNFTAPDLPPQFFLAGIAMKQVVSYEVVDTDMPDVQTKLAIFALSDANELYYVEAWRPYSSNILRFRTSGLPMANGVDKLSTQYNATHDATELIYIGDGDDEVYHLARTDVGWAHNRIMIKHAAADVEIKKAPAGKIRIVAFTDSSLVGPQYTLTLTKFTGQPKSFAIHSTQRVLRIMAAVEVDPSGASQILVDVKKPKQSGDFTTEYSRDENGRTQKNSGSWIDEAVDALDHVIADVMAFIRKAVKTVVKFAIKVVGPVVTFFFKIAGKVIKFVAKQAVAHFLDEYLGTHLEDFLNWLSFIFDVEKTKQTQQVLLDTLSLGRELVDVQMHNWGDSINTVIENTRSNLSTYIKDQRAPLQPNGDKFTDATRSTLLSQLDFLFNNPIISTIEKYNPLTIFMDAVTGGISDALAETGTSLSLTGDSVWTKILTILADFFVQEGENFTRLLEDTCTRISDVVADFSKAKQEVNALLGDAFWTLFDSIKILIVQLWKLITALIDGIMDLVAQELPVPIVKDLWEDFAEQPFSIINIITYVAAQIFNIISITMNNKLPFESWGDPRQTLRDFVAGTKAQGKNAGRTASLSADALAASLSLRTANACNVFTTFSTLGSMLLSGLLIANEKGSASTRQEVNDEYQKLVAKQAEGWNQGEAIRLLDKDRSIDAGAASWEWHIQNTMFACDVVQIVPRFVALSVYTDLIRTNEPFKKGQTDIDGTKATQALMLISSIIDCGARGLAVAFTRGTMPATSLVATKLEALKTAGSTRLDAICDGFATFNCIANAIGSGVSIADSVRGKRSEKMNGCGLGSSVALAVAGGTSCYMKWTKNYNPYVEGTMLVGLGSGGVLWFVQFIFEGKS